MIIKEYLILQLFTTISEVSNICINVEILQTGGAFNFLVWKLKKKKWHILFFGSKKILKSKGISLIKDMKNSCVEYNLSLSLLSFYMKFCIFFIFKSEERIFSLKLKLNFQIILIFSSENKVIPLNILPKIYEFHSAIPLLHKNM